MTDAVGRPLHVAHVIHRFQVGGLENGLVNLVNGLPEEEFRHSIVCLTEHTAFRERLRRPDVELHALHKKDGKDPDLYRRLWRLFRRIRPDVVHTRNLAALEAQIPAALTGVPARVHGEHGWDVDDLSARSRKNRWIRRGVRPFVHRYVALSGHIEDYLRHRVGVPPGRIERICNGVDIQRFAPRPDARRWVAERFGSEAVQVIGTVERLEAVKDPLNLARSFAGLCRTLDQPLARRLRLVVVGGGPLSAELECYLADQGLTEQCWLAGSREDVPELMAGFDLFVLPSLAEGISNTILEAMACGLPVVATRVGGNAELVAEGETGTLVPAADPAALAAALANYVTEPERCGIEGRAGRARVERQFSLPGMVERYRALYRAVSRGRARSQDELTSARRGSA